MWSGTHNATDRRPVLLDTHFWIWIQEGGPFRAGEARFLDQQAAARRLRLSVISTWEVAMLSSKGRLTLNVDLAVWVQRALQTDGLTTLPLTPEIAIESCQLPGVFHNDPADRIIVATARVHRARLLTRDKAILKYARQHALPLVNA